MPRKVAPLTELQCRNAKPKDKDYKLADGNNLNLHISPAGGKVWRLAYKHNDKFKSYTIGKYPTVGLAKARELAERARTQIFEGLDPSGERKAAKLVAKVAPDMSFEAIARDWHAKRLTAGHWKSKEHAGRILRGLERDIFPYIGRRDVTVITTPEILAVLLKIQERGSIETSQRINVDLLADLTLSI